MLSTKESLEDVLGDISDHSTRDQKFQTASSDERVFFSNCFSRRLKNVKYLRLQPGDLANGDARKHTANRLQNFGVEMQVTSHVTKQVKEQCRKGPGSFQIRKLLVLMTCSSLVRCLYTRFSSGVRQVKAEVVESETPCD